MTTQKKMAPAANQDHSKNSISDSSIADAHSGIDATAYVSGVYVAVVQIRSDSPEPRYRRRVVFNLPAANRAVDRAHIAGLDASVVLCQLTPVDGGGHRG